MDCTLITDHCLACGTGEAHWKGWDGSSQAKFPQYDASYNSYQKKGQPCGCGGIGGINNSKNYRTSASSFTLLKKSLMTIRPPLPGNGNLPAWTPGGFFSAGYIGGPGDAVKSVPIITAAKSGWRARLVTMPHQTGVDVKHGSYQRFLAQKTGFTLTCQNC